MSGLRRGLLTGNHLRRGVIGRGHDVAGCGWLVGPEPATVGRNPEIGELGPAVSQQDVAGFDVTVDDAGAVHGRERPSDLGADLDDSLTGQSPLDVGQRRGAHQLHDEIEAFGVLPGVVDGDEMGVG